MSRQQLQDAIDKLDARVFVGSGGGSSSISSVGASIEAKAANFFPALRLAIEVLKEPAFPETDFENVRKQRIAALESARTDPSSLSQWTIAPRISPYPQGHPLHPGTLDSQIAELQKLTLDDVKKFHANYYGAQFGELVVVGQIDQAAFLKEAETLLAGWKTPASYQRMIARHKAVPAFNEKIETPDKENAQFEAALRVQLADTDPAYPAMIVANYILGGTISARVPNRIRNKEGLSYGARTGFSVSTESDAAIFTANVIANPANMPKVEKFFLEEVNLALKDGFTEAELTAAKKALKDVYAVGRSQDASILRTLLTREQRNRTMAWDEQIESKIQAVTLAEVNAAFRKYITPAQISIVKAGDFKKAGVWQ
jgi:zinc protease